MSLNTVLFGLALLTTACTAHAASEPKPVAGHAYPDPVASLDQSQAVSDELIFDLDDNSPGGTVGLNTNGVKEYGSIYLNRFTVTQPLTINSISIFWPSDSRLMGLQFNLVAYYEVDGDGNPSNAVRLGSDVLKTIETVGAYVSYPVNFSVPGAGDIYIGFVDEWALNGYSPVLFPASIDGTDPQGDSYVAYNINPTVTNIAHLGDNSHLGTIDVVSNGLFNGNWGIQGTGITQPNCIFANGFDGSSSTCSSEQ